MARKKTKRFLRKYMLIISSIAALNFVGVSYATWNNQLNVSTTVTTGSIDPYFCNRYKLDNVRGDGDLTIRFEDDQTMVVEGEVSPNYKSFLHYGVLNKGNIPVKFASQHQKIDEGLKLQLNQQTGILDPKDNFCSETGNPKLHIQADDTGTYNFEMELVFNQYNQP